MPTPGTPTTSSLEGRSYLTTESVVGGGAAKPLVPAIDAETGQVVDANGHRIDAAKVEQLEADLAGVASETFAETKAAEAAAARYTDAEKTKLASLESSKFKGTFATLAGLEAAVVNPAAGDYGDVDGGPGVNAVRYAYDVDEGWVAGTATAETAASVREKLLDNPDTNVLTDAEKAAVEGVAQTGAVPASGGTPSTVVTRDANGDAQDEPLVVYDTPADLAAAIGPLIVQSITYDPETGYSAARSATATLAVVSTVQGAPTLAGLRPFVDLVVAREATAATPNDAPTAGLSLVSTDGLSVTVDVTASDSDGTVSSVSLEWGDSTTAATGTGQKSHTYASAGTYDLVVTATDDDGETGTATLSVTVTAPAGAAPAPPTNLVLTEAADVTAPAPPTNLVLTEA